MKMLGLAIVVALGLAVGLLWPREDSPVPPMSSGSAVEVGQPVKVDLPSWGRVHHAATRPVLAHRDGPTLEAKGTIPALRKRQEALRKELLTFASDVELTDAQWDRFERDLFDVAETESAAFEQGLKADNFEGVNELSEELGRELVARAAGYMTKKQVSELRFRFHVGGLVTRVRQLHFVPVGPAS